MKKFLACLLVVCMSISCLSACALPSLSNLSVGLFHDLEDDSEEYDCSFPDMQYTRPELDAFESAVAAAEAALDSGEKEKKVIKLLDGCYAEYYNFNTMYTIADIRSCQNTADTYYATEYDWCSDNFYLAQQLMEELYYACAESSLAQKLEEDYFWDGFLDDYSNSEEAYYSDESVELMRRESTLISQYRNLSADPQIELNGETVGLYEYQKNASYDEYYTAQDAYYEQYNERFSDLFIQLVEVRRELAECMGFDSYEQMQYEYFFDRDYSPEQAQAYVEDIKEYMLPLYREVMAENPYDEISYGYLSEDELMNILGSVAGNMGGDIEEAFNYMIDYELYDVELRDNKADISFQTYIDDYEAPFLFVYPYGDIEDVLTVSHELGHFVDAYVNYNSYETTDLAECYSQSLEFLTLSNVNDALSRSEVEQLYRIKMLDVLELYIQQASFDEFERQVYEQPSEKLSREFLNQLSLDIAKEYGYYDGYSETYYSMSWSDISHFFEQPFYVIAYPVSIDIAMQIYELEQNDQGAGLEKLQEMLPRDCGEMLLTAESAGLKSPFSEGRVQSVVEDLRGKLA